MEKAFKFRRSLRARERLNGVFVKIPHPHIVEVLATTNVDFIVLDAEHSPFSLSEIDQCILASRASPLICLVRVSNHDQEHIGSILDLGADGIIAPHICNRADAETLLTAALYGDGERGVSMSHRAGTYGARGGVVEYCERSDQSTIIIAQIEDRDAIENLPDILLEQRIDGFFIGKVDLLFSYGFSDPEHPELLAQIDHACRQITRAERALGAYVTNADEAHGFRDQGHTFLALGSDHSHLRASISDTVSQIQSPGGETN